MQRDAVLVPVLNKHNGVQNDFGPVALTSVFMTILEKLVGAQIVRPHRGAPSSTWDSSWTFICELLLFTQNF